MLVYINMDGYERNETRVVNFCAKQKVNGIEQSLVKGLL